MDFVLGLGIALPVAISTGISVTTGVAQGVQEQKKQNADASNQARMLKFHLNVWIEEDITRRSRAAMLLASTQPVVTLSQGRCWIQPGNIVMEQRCHPFTGFYLAYPDDARAYTRGLVSTISIDPPMLNWIYVDRDTYQVRYANRSGSIAHLVGDFDWTTDDINHSCMTFDGFEGFVAMEDETSPGDGVWGLYFDVEDDGLNSIRGRRRTLEVHLQRRIITGQEVNKWGLKEEGNIGFKATREV